MAQAIDFYFDFSSPYGYLGSELIGAIGEKHGVEVVWRPYLMGAVFKQLGTSPLISQPVKGPYSRHDLMRSARLYGIPFNIPDPFPVNSLAACRAYYWLADRDRAVARQFAQALYRGYFIDNRNVSEPEVVIAAGAALGIDPSELAAALQDAGVKARLRDEVEGALEKGVFGAPFFIYGDEQFWGCDRLDQLNKWLETGGW
jgi:2-hydroxychromene-2-carboxylate isomerase